MDADCRKSDPELGCDYDLILNAQDEPDHGFQIKKCENASDWIQLQGVGEPQFVVNMRMAKIQKVWKVIGVGLVNIAKPQQTPEPQSEKMHEKTQL